MSHKNVVKFFSRDNIFSTYPLSEPNQLASVNEDSMSERYELKIQETPKI